MSKKDFSLFEHLSYMNATENAGSNFCGSGDWIDAIWTWFVLITAVVCILVLIVFGVYEAIEVTCDGYHYTKAIEYVEDGKYRDASDELDRMGTLHRWGAMPLIYYCDARIDYAAGDYYGAYLALYRCNFAQMPYGFRQEAEEFRQLVHACV